MQIVQIIKTALPPTSQNNNKYQAGALISIERKVGFLVKCKVGVLSVETVRPAGKGLMPAFAYINGKKYEEGKIIFK